MEPMKTTVSVIVLTPFTWKGQSYLSDQSIDLTPLDAVALSHARKVTLTRRKVKAVIPSVVTLYPERPKRRPYKRRDVQAEDISQEVEVDLVQPDPIVES